MSSKATKAFGLFLNSIETISSLQAFRKRHSEAQRVSNSLASQPTTIDFSQYRAVLKNQAIVDDAEEILKNFKPVTYDVNTHIKAIGDFEAKAVRTGVFLFSVESL
jgi:F-type H+-transporting ATPase subunit d